LEVQGRFSLRSSIDIGTPRKLITRQQVYTYLQPLSL